MSCFRDSHPMPFFEIGILCIWGVPVSLPLFQIIRFCNGCSGWEMSLHSRWVPVILDVCVTDLHLCKCWCSVCSAAQCIDGFSVHCCIAEIHECGDRAKNIHVVLRLLLSYCYLIAYCKCGWEAILVLFSTLRKSECPKFQFFENQNVRISILRKPECPIYQNLIFLVVANKQKRQNMWVY